jgi:hypothetical protein
MTNKTDKENRQQFQASWARTKHHLLEALPAISALMDAKLATAGAPDPDSGLAQIGLRGGADIVREFIEYNELGLALEHLCYMVIEAELPISELTYACLEAAGIEMQMDAANWQQLNPRISSTPQEINEIEGRSVIEGGSDQVRL